MSINQERFIKWTLFTVITAVTLVLVVTFPNVPFLKDVLKGGRQVDSNTDNPDPRFLDWFNRDPDRTIPAEPRVVLAPADGYVLGLKEIAGRQHIVIEMRYTDVHVQRMPLAGKVINVKGGGKILDETANIGEYWGEKMLPFQKMTTMETEIGEVIVRQITSLFAKRIEVWVKPDQEVARGDRLGRVLAGSTVVLELPGTVQVEVSLNDEVLAGETIVARY